MSQRMIATLNAGSSSLRCALFAVEGEAPAPRLRLSLRGLPSAMIFERVEEGGAREERELAPPEDPETAQEAAREELVARLLEEVEAEALLAVSHRVVHGGRDFRAPVAATPEVLRALDALSPLAPGHQPHNLAAIRDLAARLPRTPQIACFDTAFHASLPRNDRLFGLPRELAAEGVVRFGFHGLSYDFVSGRLEEIAPEVARGRVIIGHLGHGVSFCGLGGGRSVATTMGMTALDGPPMGRRCGALDPGVVLHLIEGVGMAPEEVRAMLYERSGLLGLSGISDEMLDLLHSEAESAREAVDFFVYRCRREIGSLAAAIGGLDALVFTGGMGEHAPEIRERIADGLGWLGVEIDREANRAGATRLSAEGAGVALFLIPTDEERVLAQGALSALGADEAPGAGGG